MIYPKEFNYTKEHEWTQSLGKTIKVGITHHAQSALGDVVFVELSKVGRVLKSGETFGVVESIKAVSDLYSPMSGKITRINESVVNEPSLINHDPHGEAWLVEMEPESAQYADGLMNASQYEAYVQSLT
jgi:glycine cleavage system H protein